MRAGFRSRGGVLRGLRRVMPFGRVGRRRLRRWADGACRPLRGDGEICHHLPVRRPDDHHIPMLETEVRMSITEVEAAYTEAAQ